MFATFAIALAAIAVPVIIHLFNRTRYRRIDWAAMEFLLAAYKRTRRRIQYENLLLLALRILAVMFLAFAFFPDGVEAPGKWLLDSTGVSLVGAGDGGKARHLILVVDDTASMAYRDTTLGVSSHERAVEKANSVVSTLKEGRDTVTLVRVSVVEPPRAAGLSELDRIQRLEREIPVFDPRQAAELLTQSRPSAGTGSVMAALQEARRRLEAIDTDRFLPMVVVVSDFRQNNWTFAKEGDGEHQTFVSLVQGMDGILSAQNSTLTFIDAGPAVAANYGIVDVVLQDPLVGVGVETAIEVTVGNFASGTSLPQELRLQYRIDAGEARSFSQPVMVKPGTTETVVQRIGAFGAAGSHSVRVEIVGKDALEEDNARSVAVSAIASRPILLVNGDASDDISEDETYFLKKALDLRVGDGETGVKLTPNLVQVVSPKNLSTTMLEEHTVVIVCNLDRPTTEFAARLEEYVREGGGSVMFAMGDRVDVDVWNRELFKDGRGVLPARLKAPVRIAQLGANTLPRSMVAVDVGPTSPLRELGLNQAERENMQRPEAILGWMGVELPQNIQVQEGQEPLEPARTFLAVNHDGRPPLLVGRAHGRGQTLLWTSTVDGDWHELWSTEELPLLYLAHDLVRALSVGDRLRRNLTVGDHFVRVLAEKELTPFGNQIETPTGVADEPLDTLLPDGRRRLTFTRTASAGLYRLQFLNRGTAEAPQPDPTRSELFAVNSPGIESDMLGLGSTVESAGNLRDTLMAPFKALASVQLDSGAEAGSGLQLKPPPGRLDLWVLFLGIAALFLLAEMAACVWFGRRAES